MDNLFLDALNGRNTDRPPVWLMRQAGRYLPEYAQIRKRHTLWQMFHEPELACQITALPLKRFGLDAAILFSDILVIAEALGLQLAFPEGFGPVITPCLETAKDIDDLQILEVEEILGYVKKTIKLICKESKVPLIGFCGGPFTVASYMIDREGKEILTKTKQWLYQDPQSFHRLLQKITDASIRYLHMQIDAGVNAIQIFDSWAGILAYPEWNAFCFTYLEKMVAAVRAKNIPVILFARGSGMFASELAKTGANAISIDWQIPLSQIRKDLGKELVLQGNLDPHVLLTSREVVKSHTLRLLDSMKNDPSFIFNLGHGVLPTTPVENVECLVDTILQYR